jgi:hypothetical protein
MTTMQTTLKTLAVGAVALLGLGTINAQTARTEVAPSQPKGELSVPNQDRGMKPQAPVESRAGVKADALAAERAASIPKGEQSTARQGKAPVARTGSTTTRADVNAEAAAANQAGTIPRGQSSVEGQDKGGVKK